MFFAFIINNIEGKPLVQQQKTNQAAQKRSMININNRNLSTHTHTRDHCNYAQKRSKFLNSEIQAACFALSNEFRFKSIKSDCRFSTGFEMRIKFLFFSMVY